MPFRYTRTVPSAFAEQLYLNVVSPLMLTLHLDTLANPVQSREGWGLLITPESALLPMPGVVFFLLAMFGSFLCCFNSPAAPAADKIRVQKKRVVSDALIAKML